VVVAVRATKSPERFLKAVVIVIMGFIVGFVALALISAMYGIYHQVKA
jgi:hypothetical protein